MSCNDLEFDPDSVQIQLHSFDHVRTILPLLGESHLLEVPSSFLVDLVLSHSLEPPGLMVAYGLVAINKSCFKSI